MTKVYMVPYDDDPFTYNTDYYTLSNGFGLTGAQPGSLENQDFYPIYNATMDVTMARLLERYQFSPI
jgi:aminopeptidase-like protein